MTITLGPASCSGCGTLLFYGTRSRFDVAPRWRTKGGNLHRCTPDPVDATLGPVRVCVSCGEEWPRDPEFFRLTNRLSVRRQCRACEYEANDARRAQLRAAAATYRARRRVA